MMMGFPADDDGVFTDMKSPGIKRSGKVREPCWESGQIMYRNVSSKCAAIVTTLFQAGSKVCYFRLF